MKALPPLEVLEEISKGEPASIIGKLGALGIPLPGFLKGNLPEGNTFTITREGEKFLVVETGVRYDEIKDAYRASRGIWNVIKFDESVSDVVSNSPIFGFHTEEADGSNTLFVSGLSAESHYAEEYVDFLIAAVKYREKPEDLARAWSFIERHPAFWVKKGREGNKVFATDEGASLIEICIYPDEDNGNTTKVVLEMGGHVETDNYETRYLDVLLVSSSNSIDSAMVILAKKIEKYYDYEGESTPEAEIERTEYFENKGWNRK